MEFKRWFKLHWPRRRKLPENNRPNYLWVDSHRKISTIDPAISARSGASLSVAAPSVVNILVLLPFTERPAFASSSVSISSINTASSKDFANINKSSAYLIFVSLSSVASRSKPLLRNFVFHRRITDSKAALNKARLSISPWRTPRRIGKNVSPPTFPD